MLPPHNEFGIITTGSPHVEQQGELVASPSAPVQSIPDRAAAIALSSMSDERTQWRLYRQELHIAACSDSDLARMLHDAITGTDP